MKRLCLVAAALLAAGCPHPIPRPYPAPEGPAVLTWVRDVRQRIGNLRAETKSDVRIGSDRANVTVYILAAWGGRLRFMAMNPSNNMAADLASDGTRFCFLDSNHDCGDCGPATPENVAQLIRIQLEPDDVVATLLGSTPVLENAAAAVSWDSGEAYEIVDLKDDRGFTQRIVLDGRDRRWDVLDSRLRDPQGKTVWRIQHKDFHAVKKPDGTTVRLPGRSMFEQAGDSALILWKKQEADVALDPSKFQIEVPVGLRVCGRKP